MAVSSKLVEDAILSLSSFPGIGKKTALRLVLYLINKDKMESIEKIIRPLERLVEKVQFCQTCANISDGKYCTICMDHHRNKNLICVVENIRDVIAIEETGHYNGVYHIIGGVISPLEGIGVEDLNIASLLQRVTNDTQEVIMAVSPTIEGETTIYYLSKKIVEKGVKVSQLARGISFGGELEYADGLTLGRSILGRIPYNEQQL
jgi:recombination protein RecR